MCFTLGQAKMSRNVQLKYRKGEGCWVDNIKMNLYNKVWGWGLDKLILERVDLQIMVLIVWNLHYLLPQV